MKTFKGVRQRILVQQRFAGISSLYLAEFFWMFLLVYLRMELDIYTGVFFGFRFLFNTYVNKCYVLLKHSYNKLASR